MYLAKVLPLGKLLLLFFYGLPAYGIFLRIGTRSEFFYLNHETQTFIEQLESTVNAGNLELYDVDFITTFYIQPEKNIRREALPAFFGFDLEWPNFIFHNVEINFGFGGIFHLPSNTLFYQGSAELVELKVCTISQIAQCPLARWGFVEQNSGSEVYQLTATANEFYWGPNLALSLIWQNNLWEFYGKILLGLTLHYYQLYSRQDFSWQLNRFDNNQNSYAILAEWENRGLNGKGFSLKPLLVFRLQIPLEIRLGLTFGYLGFNNHAFQSLRLIKNTEIYAQSLELRPTKPLETTFLGISLQLFYLLNLS